MRSALIAAVLLALILCGCSGEQQSQAVNDSLAKMENELTGMEEELAEFKDLVEDLKLELSDCKDELQNLAQQKLQEQAEVAEDLLEEVPALPDHPTEHPTGELPDIPASTLE